MKLEKTTAAARPRGNQANRYNLHLHQKKYSRTCLNLIYILANFWADFSFIGTGRYLNHQPAIQYSGYTKLFAPLFSVLLTCVSPVITALARGLNGDQRLPKCLTVHTCEHCFKRDRVHWYRTTLLKAIISCISCLALGVLAALLLRNSRTRYKQQDIDLGAAYHTRGQYQDIKRSYLRTLAAILITPFSSNQTHIHRQIAKCFNRLFNIRAILEMDVPISNPRGVYQPAKHHAAEAEALTLRDIVSEERENTASMNQGWEDTSPDVSTSFGRSTSTWAPDPGHGLSNQSSRTRLKAKRRPEAEGTATYGTNFDPPASSSNTTSPAGTPTRDLGSIYLDQQESISPPSSGSNRAGVRKARSGIFRHGSNQVNVEIPPMPRQGMFYRATSSFLRSNPNRREDVSLVADRSISGEESTISLELQGPINLIRVRNLEMEEQARAMGFDVSQNRFGLPEEFVGSNTTPPSQVPTGVRLIRDLAMEAEARALGFTLPKNRFGLPEEIINNGAFPTGNEQEASSDAGTMVDLVTSDDDSNFADDEVTVFDDAETALGDHGPHSPPTAAEIPVKGTEGGLDYLQVSPSDSMSWLTDCFTTSNIDLLKDFGTPPKVATHSSHSSPTFKMTDETRSGLHNLGAPPMIGDFGTCEAEQAHNSGLGNSRPEQDNTEQVQNPELGRSQPQQDNAEQAQNSDPGHAQPEQRYVNEVGRLRRERIMLVEKFLAMCKVKDSEIKDLKAREAAALERVKVLEKMLELYSIDAEYAGEPSDNDNAFDPPTNTCGGQQKTAKTGFPSTSKDSNSGHSSGNRSSHKKSKSQEGGFFKNLIGTTEPSLSALKKLTERSLLEANVSWDDPDLAAKLKVSSRQLPLEAPKPASKDPVPRAKSGTIGMLRRFSSLDNLKRKDDKSSGSSEAKNYSKENNSQNSRSSLSKDASLTSISEEFPGGSKSLEKQSAPPSYRDRVVSFSEDSSPPANRQCHSKSSVTLTGQYDPDLKHTLAALTTDRSQEQGSGAIPQGWEYMDASRYRHQEECNEPDPKQEDYEGPVRAQHTSQPTFKFSVGALAHDDQAVFDGDHGDQALRSNPPSRSPPACPGLSSFSSEGREQCFERQEAHKEQSKRARASTTPERPNLNKSLPEINPEELDKQEDRKYGKKRGLKSLFARK